MSTEIEDNPFSIKPCTDKEYREVMGGAKSFKEEVYEITNALAEMLISKNVKYGSSALEPKRIFSKASPVEQILVRLDDKLSRMANDNANEDEDILEDLLGYIVLLKIAKGKK